MLNVKKLLYNAAYHPAEIAKILDRKNPAILKFDPELGYLHRNHALRDGMDDIVTEGTYDPRNGNRKMVNYPDRPCRINTYGDSYTQCAQVSDGETWQEVLAALFREPVRNFGVGGYGVYQAYRRAMRVEATGLAAEYIILNIWDDDHMRNIEASRWPRVAWMVRDLPRGGIGRDTYPVHGFPWAHLRYDLDKGAFVELPGLCKKAEDLRKLTDRDYYYKTFKDDAVVNLFTLRSGGEAAAEQVEQLEKLAEAFGMNLNLRDPERRIEDARKLNLAYGMRSTMYLLDNFRHWARKENRKLLVLLSYDVPSVQKIIEKNERFDEAFLNYLKNNNVLFVDCLAKAAEDYRMHNLSLDNYLSQYYVGRAGAQVFGHYNPAGNFWFASAIKREIIDWLNPKPPAYR